MDKNVLHCENSKNRENPENEQLNNEEEHGAVDDINDNDIGKQRETEIETTHDKQSYGDVRTQIKLYHFSRGGEMSSGMDRQKSIQNLLCIYIPFMFWYYITLLCTGRLTLTRERRPTRTTVQRIINAYENKLF